MTRVINRQWPAESESHPGEFYVVTEWKDGTWGCDCKHWVFRLQKKMNELQQTKEPFSDPKLHQNMLGLADCKHIKTIKENPRRISQVERDIIFQKNLRYIGGAVEKARKAIRDGRLDPKQFTDFFYRAQGLEAIVTYYEERSKLWSNHVMLLEQLLTEEQWERVRQATPKGCGACGVQGRQEPCEDLETFVPSLLGQDDLGARTPSFYEACAGVLHLATFYAGQVPRLAKSRDELAAMLPDAADVLRAA